MRIYLLGPVVRKFETIKTITGYLIRLQKCIFEPISQPYRERMMPQTADDDPRKNSTADAEIKVINNRKARIGEDILLNNISMEKIVSVLCS